MSSRIVAQPRPPLPPNSLVALSLFLLCALFQIGCAAPGEPTAPSPPIPNPVGDLKAHQLGDAVLLTFTLPNKSTLGAHLTTTPTLEVWRGSLLPDGTPNPHSFHLIDTVPGPILSTYLQDGQVSYPSPLQPEELRNTAGQTALYRVRTRVSERKSSQNSNDATVDLYPVPQDITNLDASVSEKSIKLTWTPPDATSAGAPLPPIQSYHVYRGELDPASASAAENDLHAAKWTLPLLQIGITDKAEYQDSSFDFDKTYAYVVRTVISEGGSQLESGNSHPKILTPKDIYPPAAPQDVVAAVLPGSTPGSFLVDLSWSINLETDLAGYRVYRSETENQRGQLLTPDLLPTSAFRDSSVHPAHKYWYAVTAVDRAGNESSASAPTVTSVP
jgi:hypothetical protein